MDGSIGAAGRAIPESRRVGGRESAHGSDLRRATAQMEALFLKMMFEEMGKSVDRGTLFPESPGRDLYQEWFTEEVAKQFAVSGGLGLSEIIARPFEDTFGSSRSAFGTSGQFVSGVGGPSLRQGAVNRSDGQRRPRLEEAAARHSDERLVKDLFSNSRESTWDRRKAPPLKGRVTSPYGPRIHPVLGVHSFHHGVDIAAPPGSPIRTPFAGRVVKIEEDSVLGLSLTLDHAGGYRSVYGHLSEVEVEEGQTVPAGSVVAQSGDSGRVTGPHLHFTLLREGKSVDPSLWIRFGR